MTVMIYRKYGFQMLGSRVHTGPGMYRGILPSMYQYHDVPGKYWYVPSMYKSILRLVHTKYPFLYYNWSAVAGPGTTR